MASNPPVENDYDPYSCSQEALKQTSVTMKERFEGLAAWKDKQKEERDLRVEELELELQIARDWISLMGIGTVMQVEVETQTMLEWPAKVSRPEGGTLQEAPRKEPDAELGNLKGQSKLDDAEDMKKSLHDRFRDTEKELTALRAQVADKEQALVENRQLKIQLESVLASSQKERTNGEEERSNVAQVKDEYIKLLEDYDALKQEMKKKEPLETENATLKLQLESLQTTVKIAQKGAEDERSNMARVKREYTKLFEDYSALKQEMKKKEPTMSKEETQELQARLVAAEEALVVKQQKIDEMKQEVFKKEQELETISVFQAQAEVYSSDFYAERAAREKLHEEKERLSTRLELVENQYSLLQEYMGRQAVNEIQRRHEVSHGAGPQGGAQQPGSLEAGGAPDIQEYACPKCNEIHPDLDSLQIHIMDCII